MPADFAHPTPDSDKCPKSIIAEMGHIGALWDIDRSFNLAEVQLFAGRP